jgi:hypothetical protein
MSLYLRFSVMTATPTVVRVDFGAMSDDEMTTTRPSDE